MWIEIISFAILIIEPPSRPARALWIEIITKNERFVPIILSRPARALWIEIPGDQTVTSVTVVEAREGLVD